jgi:hypothetical protein
LPTKDTHLPSSHSSSRTRETTPSHSRSNWQTAEPVHFSEDAITLLDDCGIKLYPAALQLQGTDPVVWMSFLIKEMEQFINKEPEFDPDDTSTIASGKDETGDDDDDDEDHLPMPMNWRAAFEKVLH